MEPTPELLDPLYMDKVLAARQRSPEEKFLAAGDMFISLIERMRMGVRMQFPHANEEEVQRELHRRFEIARRLEQSRESQ